MEAKGPNELGKAWLEGHNECLQELTPTIKDLRARLAELEKIDRSCPAHEDLRGLCSDLERRLAAAEKALKVCDEEFDLLGQTAEGTVEYARYAGLRSMIEESLKGASGKPYTREAFLRVQESPVRAPDGEDAYVCRFCGGSCSESTGLCPGCGR